MHAEARISRFASAFVATRAVSAVLSSVLSLAACNRPAPAPAAPAAPAESYAMRGEIVRLPAADSREIVIRHEAVPDFRDEAGKVVSMEAMTMPFTLAGDLPAASLAGLAPGDRIAFTLEMRWQDPSEIARITRIAKLPEGTTLAWESPPETAPAEAPASASGSPDSKPQ